mgnify:CR=1 FL=1
MSRLMGLYAQHLGVERACGSGDEAAYRAAIDRARELVKDADAIVAGLWHVERMRLRALPPHRRF